MRLGAPKSVLTRSVICITNSALGKILQSQAISKQNLTSDGSSALEFVGGASRALRARETLLRAILKHEFPDGRLPPEDELGRRLGVSRTTIRTALQSLEQHGVVNRTPGRGTSVHERMSPPLVALQRLIGFADLIREQGHEVTYTPTLRVMDEPSAVVIRGARNRRRYRVLRDRARPARRRPACRLGRGRFSRQQFCPQA